MPTRLSLNSASCIHPKGCARPAGEGESRSHWANAPSSSAQPQIRVHQGWGPHPDLSSFLPAPTPVVHQCELKASLS